MHMHVSCVHVHVSTMYRDTMVGEREHLRDEVGYPGEDEGEGRLVTGLGKGSGPGLGFGR